MKNNIISLAQYLLDINKPEELCQYKAGSLSIITGSLLVDLTAEVDIPDFIKLSIREFGFSNAKYIISELIPLEDSKNLINNFWIKFEEKRNQKFIDTYGLDEYKSYYESYLSALKGQKENSKFFMEDKSKEDKITFILTNKETELVTPLILLPNQKTHLDDEDLFERVNGAIIFRASTLIKPKNKNKYESGCFSIFIPNIKAKEYNLYVEIDKKYDDKNMLNYLIDNIKDDINKKILISFELQQELPNEKGNKIKRPKV